MQKRSNEEKVIAMETNDRMILIPNKSVGSFVLGMPITGYLSKKHVVKHFSETYFEYDSYIFIDDKITVDVEEDIIQTITCDNTCFWDKENLIRMNFDRFQKKYNIKYDSYDEIYLVGVRQTQKVYDFDKLGLQIWVWRNLIRTVIVSKYEEKDEL